MSTTETDTQVCNQANTTTTTIDVGTGLREPRAGNRRRNALIGTAAVAVALTGLAGYQLIRTQNEASIQAASPPVAAAPALDAYAPGGSVYNQQVPTARTPALDAYAPGGSVYNQQVPTVTLPVVPHGALAADAAEATPTPALDAYAPGGSVYNQQVPTTER